MIHVLIGAQRQLYRAGLAALLRAVPEFTVTADVGHYDEAAEAVSRCQPDVLLLDIDQQDGHAAIDSVAELCKQLTDCRVALLTEAGWPGLLRKAMETQVTGLLDKDAPPEHLIDMVRRVAGGERMVDPNLAVTALYLSASPFTEREIDVLRIAADGASAAEIAQKLSLTQGTVRNYLSRIMNKTSARTRIDAVRIAQTSGWL